MLILFSSKKYKSSNGMRRRSRAIGKPWSRSADREIPMLPFSVLTEMSIRSANQVTACAEGPGRSESPVRGPQTAKSLCCHLAHLTEKSIKRCKKGRSKRRPYRNQWKSDGRSGTAHRHNPCLPGLPGRCRPQTTEGFSLLSCSRNRAPCRRRRNPSRACCPAAPCPPAPSGASPAAHACC